MTSISEFVLVRSGFVEVGDMIYIPLLEHSVEVEEGSLYLGSRVCTHTAVRRHPSRTKATDHFASVTDRLDHVAEHDSVNLVNLGGTSSHRVVAYKDAQFVYLRNPSCPSQGNTNRVCRKTGKVFAWTPTGWDTLQATMYTSEEMQMAVDPDRLVNTTSAKADWVVSQGC